MVDISRKTYERNGVETIVNSDGTLWLNKKHIKEGLDYRNLHVTNVKYYSAYRKHRYEVVDEPKNNPTEFLYTRISNQIYYGLQNISSTFTAEV